MSQLFDKIKVASTSRSTFDLSHHQVTSSDFGYLIPICVRDMVPNDDFTVKPNIFCRLAPMALPTYGKIQCRVHHFFVPNRIMYPQWDAFITGDPNNHTVPPYYLAGTLRTALNSDPQFNSGSSINLKRGTFGRLMSNLGLNPMCFTRSAGLDVNERINAFPFLAYYRIWMDWFMDSNIYDHPSYVQSFLSTVESGGSLATATKYLYTRNCCYKKDYYTTAKLHPQDGDPSTVGVDVASNSTNPGFVINSQLATVRQYVGGNVGNAASEQTGANTKIGQFTVEALRAANSLQRYLERNNFVGSKIINRLLAHFGVSPTPERLDMAEYIGGSSFPIQIGDITSTNTGISPGTSGTKFLGYQAGKGVGAGSGEAVSYHAKEHGIFMSVMSILPDTGYYQGVHRMWQKGVTGDPLDYFTPEFENLGYQEILNKEVYIPDNSNENYSNYQANGIFGYTPRYSEYKFQNDVLGGDFVGQLSGDFSEVIGAAEDTFHLFRSLYYTNDNPLALNSNFVELDNHNTDYDRIFQYSDSEYDHFFFNIDMDVKATRPMSGFGEPSLDANNTGDGRDVNLPYGGTRL